MTIKSYPITGMSCASCASHIEKKLNKLPGVSSCEVNFSTETAKIEFDADQTNYDSMNSAIEPLGYGLKSIQTAQSMNMSAEEHAEHTGLSQSKDDKIQEIKSMKTNINIIVPFVILSFLYMILDIGGKQLGWLPVMPEWLYEVWHSLFPLMATYTLFVIGKKYLIALRRFLKTGIASMDTLVGLGTSVAFAYSFIVGAFAGPLQAYLDTSIHYYDVTIIVIGLIYYGKYLETKSKLQTGEAIEKLLSLQAKTAIIEKDGKEIEIPIEQLQQGDIILVKPGSKIPVDGVIISGTSSIDESMISGESMPIDKIVGDKVIGSTINKQGFLKVQAISLGSESVLSHIITMVQEAQGSRAPIQKLADQISAYFVPAVLGIAVITLIVRIVMGQAAIGLVAFVSILVIACPCALGLATPTAIIVGVGKGAQHGILIKNAESLQKINKITTVVFDKTGTITKGKPELVDYIGENRNDNLKLLASLEKLSEHPLAEAIINKAKEENISFEEVSEFKIIEGKGLQGNIKGELRYAGNLKLIEDLGLSFDNQVISKLTSEGKTPILLANSKTVVGIFALADAIKENSIQAIKDLHDLGIQTVMISGDHEQTANYIAGLVGIDAVYAEVLPQDKAKIIQELQNKGKVVAMCGDGVNDAPALARANVGVAMGTGTDVAIETADITLLAGDLGKLVKAIKLSKATMRTIKQNLGRAFGYNIIGIPLAAGLFYPLMLNPIFAGLAMALSSVSVVTNSLRLKRIRL